MANSLARMPQAEEWASRICRQLEKTVESIIEVGRLLTKAKRALPHGEWGRLFTQRLIPFSRVTAFRLMAIAEHPLLSNVTHGQHLPPSWRTLYELTLAEPTSLETALKDGVIHPDMTRRELQKLLPPGKRRDKPSTIGGRTPGDRLYARVARLISDEFDKFSSEDRALFIDLIGQLLEDLKGVPS